QELGYECRKALGAAVGRAIVDDEVLFLGISKLREASPERTDVGGFGRLAGGIQHADAPDLAGRLRACGESPRNRSAAEKRDERAPFHVWMAPAWQEIIWRAAQRSLAVMCPACWCSPGGLLALMGSANRVLIIQTGSMSR